jgi:predicted acylesterase/phospholipase RssA
MDVSGLERKLQSTFNLDLVKRIVAAQNNYRNLVIQATNLDLCIPHVFNLVDASQQDATSGNTERINQILLASTAIPGAFPPREINGVLYADGGIICNLYDGTASDRADQFGSIWKSLYPNESIPKMKYWVIINEYFRLIPNTVQPTWPALFLRSLESGFSHSTRIALASLYAYAEATRLHGDGDIEVRWISIPTTWRPMNDALFNAENMQSLSDLGRSMGADPNSWNTEKP